MSQGRASEKSPCPPLAVSSELLRSASEPKSPGDGKEENKIPLFWRVFGGTTLSIVSLISMTAYNNMVGNLADLRAAVAQCDAESRKEFARIGEALGDLVPKAQCESRFASSAKDLAALKENRKELHAMKDACARMADGARVSAALRRDLRCQVDALREQQSVEEARRALGDELTKLKAALAKLER